MPLEEVAEPKVKNYSADKRTMFNEIGFRNDRIITVAFDDGGTQWKFNSVHLYPDIKEGESEWIRYLSAKEGVEIHIREDRLDSLSDLALKKTEVTLSEEGFLELEPEVVKNRFVAVEVKLVQVKDGNKYVISVTQFRFFRINGHWFNYSVL